MHLLRRNHEFEYRSLSGADRPGLADLYSDAAATRAVLVLRNVPSGEAARALSALNHSWLPYLLRAETTLMVLNLRPRVNGGKARAVVLPLSA
ncbi:hypothetical protein [Deinococcus radiotolerans]|uniref:Uncharacterized protein n=1 Tax=Deinococcus radiotolerans TaxID=1309407 RepID=A0ABQ2FLM7_9DEIO|nr:hypothetical protein [Deinococcus radiotolerans]GGL07231.1 hypothetical protein GCM10010844_27540 [Deinococcus radiotolerans]